MKTFLVLSILSLFKMNPAHATPEIKLCYEDVTVFPWITGDEEGLVFTELKQIQKELKVKFIFIRLPWKRCQLEGQTGSVDGLIAASFTKERANWGVYPTSNHGELNRELRFHTDSFFVYKRNDSAINYKNGKFENLGTNQVGVQLGYSVGNDLKDAGYPVLSSFSTAFDLLKGLEYNVVQVAILQDHDSIRVLNENPKFKKTSTRLTPPFKVADQYLLFSKSFYQKNEGLAKSIWHSIPRARKSKEYRKLENKLMSHL